MYCFSHLSLIFDSQESTELTSSTRWRFVFSYIISSLNSSGIICWKFAHNIAMFVIKLSFLMGKFELSFSKVATMFEEDERFKAVERERDRRDLFENFIDELKEKVFSAHLLTFISSCLVQISNTYIYVHVRFFFWSCSVIWQFVHIWMYCYLSAPLY